MMLKVFKCTLLDNGKKQLDLQSINTTLSAGRNCKMADSLGISNY